MGRCSSILVGVVALWLASGSAHANPILGDVFGSSGNLKVFLAVAVSSLLLEYLIIRWLLRPWVRFRNLLQAFLIINLISFPLTTIAGTIFYLFAEVIPLAMEPAMYRWWLNRVDVQVPRLRARIVGANLASFVAGLLLREAVRMFTGH